MEVNISAFKPHPNTLLSLQQLNINNRIEFICK
jgi:hypothetical protein